MPKPECEEVLYLVAVRAPIENDGPLAGPVVLSEVRKALAAALPLVNLTVGAAAIRYEALTANHNGYLREFGFSFDLADRLVTVAWEESK